MPPPLPQPPRQQLAAPPQEQPGFSAAPQGRHHPGTRFVNFSQADHMTADWFRAYLLDHGDPPRNITERSPGIPWLPWHLLFGTHGRLSFLLERPIRQVWTIDTGAGGCRGLLVRIEGDDATAFLVTSKQVNRNIIATTVILEGPAADQLHPAMHRALQIIPRDQIPW